MLAENWASPEDFATLFQYFWHRDFPITQEAIGAHRADWTIHIGVVVRSIADLMGFVTRFETGGRKDAVLRGTEGDEIAIEWEWSDVWKWIHASSNEVKKLKCHRVWSKDKNSQRLLKYAVLITYTDTLHIEEVYKSVREKWQEEKGKGAEWPLLLILIDFVRVKSKQYSSRRAFKEIKMLVFDPKGEPRIRRSAKALPWEVHETRWSSELK